MQEISYDNLEYSGPRSEGIYLRKPLTASELRQKFPRLRGIVFEFRYTAFEPQRIDHQALFDDILENIALEEIRMSSRGRATRLPDAAWKPTLRSLQVMDFDIRPPVGFQNKLEKISLQNCPSIAPVIFKTPTLESFSAGQIAGKLEGLEQAKQLKALVLSNFDWQAFDFDFSNFPNLETLTLENAPNLERLPSLAPLRNLRLLRLSNLPALQIFPAGIEHLKALETVHFRRIGNPAAPLELAFEELPNLKFLDLSEPNLDQFSKNGFLGKMPRLERLNFWDESVEAVAPQIFAENLTEIYLHGQKLRGLPPTFFKCRNLRRVQFSLRTLGEPGESWRVFSELENFQVNVSEPSDLPDFGENNSKLLSIEVSAPEIEHFPASWGECALTNLKLKGNLERLAGDWAGFENLFALHLEAASHPVFLPRNVALLPRLENIRINYDNSRSADALKFLLDLPKILTRFNIAPAQRLVFGHLLLENLADAAAYSDEFKNDFLQAVNVGSEPLKRVIWENLRMLNPARQPFSNLENLAGKTIFIAGGTRRKKSEYKEKLAEIGLQIVPKLTAATEIVLLGDGFPTDLPEDFWAVPRWFCAETDLDPLLKNAQPGFLQTLPTDERQNLRQLVWSSDPANERLILEMLKNGGVPDEFIPDLVVVAKTSRENAVRTGLRNLLKPLAGAVPYLKVLSDSRDLLKIAQRLSYSSIEPGLDVAQLLVAHFRRSGEGLDLFFRFAQSLQNPFRAEMFRQVLPKFLARAHYLDTLGNHLSAGELDEILSNPVFAGNMKRAKISLLGEHLPEKLLLHAKTLNDLEIYASGCAALPAWIGDLAKLKNLSGHFQKLTVLPDELAALKNLKTGHIYTGTPRSELQVSESVLEFLGRRLQTRG